MGKRALVKRRKKASPDAVDQNALPFPQAAGSGPSLKETEGEVVILPPADVLDTLRSLTGEVTTAILDPWYNKGVGGVDPHYHEWLAEVLEATSRVSVHMFLWGFPQIVAKALDYIPKGCELVAWLTWYYKNCPSVIRGWRPSQFACLHIARQGAKVYPEHFMNERQIERKKNGKMRYVPGPMTVIETPLLVGFVGRSEQTGHPSQKPLATIEPLVLMTTKPGDVVLDPMCGSGTTGAAATNLSRRAILCDNSEEYLTMTEERLGVKRVDKMDNVKPEALFKRSRA